MPQVNHAVGYSFHGIVGLCYGIQSSAISVVELSNTIPAYLKFGEQNIELTLNKCARAARNLFY
ncbi:hypothetical protein Megvenef_01413 [Candidatus Megaera venefica]|uniref:Uncharacterized protein n=1 Tax=Candidatus Megaera venefica TaxID=2055910 RepID=A0ABU5NE60_9RICK|nr:hypothetical protein [Candidatus Megaera venefica]MEA0971435.1 hypothetical protein [Candidatus Megaera venefica]